MLYLIFFLSGAAALIFERLWFHQVGLALGNSVWATSLVLAGFMGGLALGNGLAARLGHRLKRPLRFYAILEVTIGATGLGLVHLLPALTPLLSPLLRPFLDWPAALNALRLSLSFALLLAPSTAMGATLPVVVAALCRRDPRYGRALGHLYGWNTLGAVAGVIAAEVVLIRWLGIRGSALVAAALDGVAAAGAMRLSKVFDVSGAEPPAAASPVPPAPGAPSLLAVAFLCGGILLALEVVWFRFLLLFVDGTGSAFSVMLAVVLGGIGTGGLIASAWLSRKPGAHRHLPTLCLAGGAVSCLLYGSFDVAVRSVVGQPMAPWKQAVALAAPLIFPGSLLSGMLFTLVGGALHRRVRSEIGSTGLLTLANTVGAAIGSLVAGFVLLPNLGIERSIRWLAASYGLAALAGLAGVARESAVREKVLLAGASLVFLATLVLFPSGLMRERYLQYPVEPYRRSEQAVPVAIREGLTETILYLRVDRFGKPFYYRLLTNNFSMSATHFRSQRYMRLFVYWPVAVHPEPRSALLLCYGVGVTAKALTDTRSLETIDVVDTSKDILDLGSIVYPDPKDHPLNDPRVRMHVEDARHFLQTTERRFDIVTGEPPPPGLAGVANLYTVEYFRLLRDRLSQGGIATYWLPVGGLHESETKAIIHGFCDAFEDCSLWSGSVFNWILIGTRGASGPVPLERFRRQWDDPVVGPKLRTLALETPEQLGALFIADADDLRERTRDVPPLDDDHPKRLLDERADPVAVAPLYQRWVDVDATRRRFLESGLIRRFWPEPLREATLAAFEFQRAINAVYFRDELPPSDSLPMLHRVLSGSDLRTLPMLLLGNTVEPHAEGRHGDPREPSPDFLLGIHALSERDYSAAAAHFERAQQRGDPRRLITYYRLYALCMAGRGAEASDLAARSEVAKGGTEEDARVWRFLGETFGLGSRKEDG